MMWLARRIWGAMLWFMRRPPIKWLRMNFTRFVPEARREKAWESFTGQERWARRHGLRIMYWTVTIVSTIILLQVLGALVYYGQIYGWFEVPGVPTN